MAIRIDELNPTMLPSFEHEFPAMRDGVTYKLTLGQIRDLIAAVYDPQGIADDAFDRANHTGEQGIDTIEGLPDALAGKAGLTSANTFTKIQKWAKGADVASAAVLTLGNDGNYFNITGNTGPIAAITAKGVGTWLKLHFNGSPTITNSASIVLPGGSNIVAAAGDEMEIIEYAAGQWRCVNYTKANGRALVQTITGSGASYQIVGSSGANTLDRGIQFLDNTDAIAAAIAAVPNVIGTSTRMDFYVGGFTTGDLWLSILDNGRLVSGGTYAATTGSAANMIVASDGSFLRSTSSLRYKKDLKPLAIDIEQLAALEPRSYKSRAENDGARRFGGLISEELNAAGFDLFVEFGDEGQEEGIMYAPFAAVAVVSLARKVKELEERLSALENK